RVPGSYALASYPGGDDGGSDCCRLEQGLPGRILFLLEFCALPQHTGICGLTAPEAWFTEHLQREVGDPHPRARSSQPPYP
ncbi:MAG: hypothetical protein ACOC2T_03770, partial [Planctomycetota bacterium]